MTRYVVTLSDNNGGANCYGTFGLRKAEDVFKALNDLCYEAGTDDDTQLSCDLYAVEHWPGIRAIRKQVA